MPDCDPIAQEGAACQMLNLLPTSRGYTFTSDSYSPLELRPDPPTFLLWASNCVSPSVSLLWRIFVTWQPKKSGATTHTQDFFGKKSAKVTKFTEFTKFLLSSLTRMY
jgi:hypothetical protein